MNDFCRQLFDGDIHTEYPGRQSGPAILLGDGPHAESRRVALPDD
jgi:hypothetical protein